MKIKKIPQELVKQTKELGKELVKPATKEGIRKVAIGGAVAGVISPLYSRGFDYLWNKTKIENEIARKGTKIVIPFLIAVGAVATKIPGGNAVAGGLVGVSLVEIGKTILGLFSKAGFAKLRGAQIIKKPGTEGDVVAVDKLWGVQD